MSLANPVKPDAAGPRLTALPLEQAAALLRRSGSQRVTVESLRADLAAGALEVLRQSRTGEDWKGHTADSLADQVGAAGGASISSTIKTWRTRVIDLLLKRANHTLTESSVVVSGAGGYRLAPGITVELVDATKHPQATPPTTAPLPALPEGTRWNERQVAIAAKLAGGSTVRRKDLEVEFGVSEKTLKRDLTMMKSNGLAVPQGTGSDHTWMAGPLLRQAIARPGRPQVRVPSTSCGED